MLNLWRTKILFDKATENPPPGTPATPPAAPTETPPAFPSAKDLGYEEDPPAAPDKSTEDPPPATPPVEPEKPVIKEPSTGYSKDLEPPAEDPPPAPATPDPKDAEIVKHLGDGLPEAEVEKIKNFAKANDLSEKALKAYGDMRRQDIQDQQAAEAKFAEKAEKQKQQTHYDWQQELKKDPVFGGDKYQANVEKVERLVQEFMPEYKNKLTEHKGAMPPYIMRDLAKLADALFKTEPLVTGDPITPPKDKDKGGDKNDPLAFYE